MSVFSQLFDLIIKNRNELDASLTIANDSITELETQINNSDAAASSLESRVAELEADYVSKQGSVMTGLLTVPTLKAGNVSGGNYSEVEADGTLKFNGDATVFDDLQFQISSGKVPASNYPTWEAFTTNTKEYSFAVNDHIDVSANELFHKWQQGSSAEFHLHVTTKGANNTGGDVFAKFTVYIAYADINEAWTETSLTAELTIPNGTPVLKHFLIDMGDIAFTNQVVGCQIKPQVKRIAATGGTEYSGNIFITQLGAHLKCDTGGSRTEYTK